MQLIGIDKSRQVILGATMEEIHGFGDAVQKLLRQNPRDKFLLIVDENLDIVDGGTRHETVSGSIATQNLLSQLDNNTKSRVLALIRSANDSDMDIQVYRKRAHGHLRKEPLKKTGNLELIKPWWIERFASNHDQDMDDSSGNNTLDFAVADDVRESLGVINALSAVASEARWQAIREKLHALKGDLKATIPMGIIGKVVTQIDQLMASDRLPRDFSNKWIRLQGEIETILAT
ncbi:Histidine ATPase [Fragilaria crotonensis]|nr:Histidine ATPase [Fragilaria crotonensis]